MPHAPEYRLQATVRPLLNDLGISPADVLRRARLPEDLLTRRDPRVTSEEYLRLWEGLEAEMDDPALPVRIAEAITAEGFHPPLFAALCSPNLEVALSRLSMYKRLIAPVRLVLERDAASLDVQIVYAKPRHQMPLSLVMTELAILVRVARMATRERIVPLRVMLPLAKEPPEAFRAYFGVTPLPSAHARLSFRPEDAAKPFLTANEAMWKTFEPDLQRRLSLLDQSATAVERVRGVLLECLPSGLASMDEVASRLGMSKRTLQRRLKGEGSSYQQLLGQTREQLARHYLAQTSLTCAEISFLLGYDEPNSFFRAFHEWTGDTPEHMRRSLRH